MESKKNLSSSLKNVSLFILGILLLSLPLVFTTLTTDPFILPKQIILGISISTALLFWGVRMINLGSLRIRRTSFDLPIILLALSAILSSIFAANRTDSLIALVPFVFVILSFFVITNTSKDKNSFLFLLTTLILGGVAVSILSALSFYKIYILPFTNTHSQSFSAFGSLLDQAIYLAILLPVTLYYIFKIVKNKKVGNIFHAFFAIASIAILIGLSTSIYQLFTTKKPLILPSETGFQTAFASISQDNGRIAQSFLFGSGFGTYHNDFTRFKQPSFNQNQNLWSMSFLRSSNFALELLATVGILGFLSFVFLISKIAKEIKAVKNNPSASLENPLLISIGLALVLSFVLPLSFTTQALIFILIALFASISEKSFDIDLHLVTLRKGLIAPVPAEATNLRSEKNKVLPSIVSFIILLLIVYVGFWSIKYVGSDLQFQESILAASNNNGLQTYEKQAKAISIFPYRDAYHRIFSQTNLALANSLALQTSKSSSPSAEIQKNVTFLIQQSISAGRNATTISPMTSLNWQNLSSVYRSLIGFGKNAENFALVTQQRAALLDPSNPQQYIALGGIYYQLGQWDNAQSQFQIAANLKPDFANAYYNIAHTLKQKGDTPNAVKQLEAVKKLVGNNAESLKKVNEEIESLQRKEIVTPEISSDKKSIGIDRSSSALPPQDPPIQIPAPNTATESGR